MKDRAFSGRDLKDALAAAGAALGLPVAALRYVVLDPGSPGRVGAQPTPARIAVMLDEPGPAAREAEPDERLDDEDDPLTLIREMVQALAETAGIEVAAQVAEEREAVVVRLDGPDRGFFFGEDGRGEVLRAFEHLLQRMFGPDLAPRPIRAEAYLDLLARWNARVNLTGARGAGDRVRLLVAPVIPVLALPDPGRLIDVGSGNGSPGLVLALLRDDLEAILLEPRARRWAFLREATRAAGRGDVEVLRRRHDQYEGPPAPTVTLRGLALPLGALARLV